MLGADRMSPRAPELALRGPDVLMGTWRGKGAQSGHRGARGSGLRSGDPHSSSLPMGSSLLPVGDSPRSLRPASGGNEAASSRSGSLCRCPVAAKQIAPDLVA